MQLFNLPQQRDVPAEMQQAWAHAEGEVFRLLSATFGGYYSVKIFGSVVGSEHRFYMMSHESEFSGSSVTMAPDNIVEAMLVERAAYAEANLEHWFTAVAERRSGNSIVSYRRRSTDEPQFPYSYSGVLVDLMTLPDGAVQQIPDWASENGAHL